MKAKTHEQRRNKYRVLQLTLASMPPTMEKVIVEASAARLEEVPGIGEQSALEAVYALGRFLAEATKPKEPCRE